MKLFPEVHLRHELYDPGLSQTDLVIPDMHPNRIGNAQLHVDESGWVHVTWLEIVPGWRKEVLLWARAVTLAGFFILLLVYFWLFGVAIIRVAGVV